MNRKINNYKKISIFILVGMVAAIFLSSAMNSTISGVDSRSTFFNNLHNSPIYDPSTYFNFTGPPISLDGGVTYYRIWIKDADPAYNWSKTAADNSWCSGSGTIGDPYVIENVFINCGGVWGGIMVEWSTQHFIIKNCWVNNTGSGSYNSGVTMSHTENGTIQDNLFTYVRTGVIFQHNARNILIDNNIMITDGRTGSRAVHCGSTSDNYNTTISNNKALNFYEGMFYNSIDNLTVDSNYLDTTYSTGGKPIVLRNCEYSNVTRNVFAGRFASSFISIQEINSVDNIIINNFATTDTATYSYDWSQIIISGPTTSQTTTHIELEDSNHNYIAFNVSLMSPGAGGGIPGFEPVILIGIVCVVSLLILKKRIKH